MLVARDDVTITHARYTAGQPIAGPHVHYEHTDAFYVLEGELTFEIGARPRRSRSQRADSLPPRPG
jgi:mannose-6-phosphate isomerase-like protein (cupin superfamily)